jgi:hypothetical protein
MSERMPAGRLTTMPTTVDAAAINPTVEIGTPMERMNNGNAGFLDIVELKMASPPVIHKSRNGDNLVFIDVTLRDCIKYYNKIKLRRCD